MNKKSKVIAGLVGLAVFSGMMYALKPNEQQSLVGTEDGQSHAEPTVFSEPPTKDEIKVDAVDEEPTTDEKPLENNLAEAKNAFEQMQQCRNDVNQTFSGMEQEVEQLASSFYINQNEFTGHGTYSTMPLESLKALAESNDSEAMAVYGMEMVWRGSRGISIFDLNRNSTISRTERRQQRREHEFNVEQVQEGASSLYQAAVHGRTGSLMMLAETYNMQLRALYRKGVDSSELEQLVAQQIATQSLLRYSLQKDAAIMNTIPDTTEQSKNRFKNMMQRGTKPRMNDDEFEETWEAIENNSAKLAKELEEQWIADREYWGYEHFTDYFNKDQEAYITALNSCNDALKKEAIQRRQERRENREQRRQESSSRL